MMDWGSQASGWAPALMIIGMLVFWGVVAAGVVSILRAKNAGGASGGQPPARTSPDQLLAERFARGEIDEPEFTSRRNALHAPTRT